MLGELDRGSDLLLVKTKSSVLDGIHFLSCDNFSEAAKIYLIVDVSDRLLDLKEYILASDFLKNCGGELNIEHPLVTFNLVKALWGLRNFEQARVVLEEGTSKFPNAIFLTDSAQLVEEEGTDADILHC